LTHRYLGSHLITLDDRGRIAIPVQFRQTLQEQCEGRLVVTADPEETLAIYPWPIWEQLEEQLLNLPGINPVGRAIVERTLGDADQRDLDKQSRLLLNPSLREYAQLEREVKLKGVGSRMILRTPQQDRKLSKRSDKMLRDPANYQFLSDHGL